MKITVAHMTNIAGSNNAMRRYGSLIKINLSDHDGHAVDNVQMGGQGRNPNIPETERGWGPGDRGGSWGLTTGRDGPTLFKSMGRLLFHN